MHIGMKIVIYRIEEIVSHWFYTVSKIRQSTEKKTIMLTSGIELILEYLVRTFSKYEQGEINFYKGRSFKKRFFIYT